MKRIWITWETQRRNHTLSEALSAKLHVIDLKGNRLLRYFRSIFKTLNVFRREYPDIIFVQNPSMVLCLLALVWRKAWKIPVIVDSHNAGLRPFEGEKPWANRIARYIVQNADITIVTNEEMGRMVNRCNGKYFVLPDPIPRLVNQPDGSGPLAGKYNVFYICTYAKDEPYPEVLNAAKLLDEEIFVYISGNSDKIIKEYNDSIPKNIVFTGFLPEKDYITMLYACDIIIDLTTRKDCLVCGAYEAVAAGKPMILSDTDVNRKYFSKGAEYTNNESMDIYNKIKYSIEHMENKKTEVSILKNELINDWEKRRNDFEALINKVYLDSK